MSRCRRRLLVPRSSTGDSAGRSDAGRPPHRRGAARGTEGHTEEEGPRLAGGRPDGRWDVDVQYSRGTARHKLLLIARGNRVEGSHIGRRLQGAVSGDVDGDRVRLRSRLPHEGTALSYRFDGTVRDQRMEGEVDLGEYGKVRWTARRVDQTSA